MSELDNFEFPKDFKVPYKNAEERNEELQLKANMLNERIILNGVHDLLKKKNYFVQAMIEESELSIPPEQETVDTFVKEFTLSYMKSDIMMQMKRLRFKSNAMSKSEYEEKQNMLKARLICIDNDDLEGISFDKLQEFEDKLGLLPVDDETKRHGMEATYAERVKAFEENLEEKNKMAEEFVQKMRTERKERNEKKRQRRQEERNRRMRANKSEDDGKAKAEKEEIRRKMEIEIRQRMEEHERQRQEMMEKWKNDEKELAKKKYVHVEMEKKYYKKVLLPNLEKKKEILRQKREYFQPIRRSQLLEHEKEYEQRLHSKLKEKKEKREKWYKDIGYGDYDPSIYQSKYLSSVENEKSMPLIDPKEGVLEQYNKKKNYAMFVKEMHKPKISVKKTEEMKRLIDEVEESGNSRKLEFKKEKPISEVSKSVTKSRDYSRSYMTSPEPFEKRDRPYGGSQSVMKPRKKYKFFNPMVPKPKLKRKGYIFDYLLQK